MQQQLFTDRYSFTELLDCSSLFRYLLNLPEISEMKIMEIPANFEEYIRTNVTSANQELIDKAFFNIDKALDDVKILVDAEAENCTMEYDSDNGNYYMSDWDLTENYNELCRKSKFLETIFNLEVWHD